MRTRQDAQKRNWLKMIIIGSYINTGRGKDSSVTEAEQDLINVINDSLSTLAMDWDKNSSKLGFNIKPHQCSWCGKRGNKPHIILETSGPKNFCYKHYKIIQEENERKA